MARTGVVHALRRAQPYIGRVAGGLVALSGAYVTLYGVGELQRYRNADSVAGAQVVDRVTGWSYDLGRWVNDVGPVRIAVVVTLALVVLGVALNQGQGRNRGGREEAKG